MINAMLIKRNMKGLIMLKIIAVVLLSTGVTASGSYYFAKQAAKKTATLPLVQDNSAELLKQHAEREEADLRLGQYAINAMYASGAKDKMSDAKKQTLARAIVRVSNDIFLKDEEKRAFISIIAIESAFQRFAQSPTGPKGYAQVAKAAFHEGMKDCGITDLREGDVWETDLNLYAGACYFRKQLDANNGDQYMAMIAYNQGPSSESLKTYTKNGLMENVEVLKYMAKFTFLKRTLTDIKQPNTTAVSDLPKALSPTTKSK